MKWLPLDEKYSISEDGLVMRNSTGRILTPQDDRRGYYRVDIGSKHRKVHRLVAERFLPAPTVDGLVIDHIDRNRLNNCASNLRWVSIAENNRNRTTSPQVSEHS